MTANDRSQATFPNDGNMLPPLPPVGEYGSHVCEIVALYLAVLPDLSLTPEQAHNLAEHIRICARCAQEQQLVNASTALVSGLGATETAPSTRVDQAVMAAIAARGAGGTETGEKVKLVTLLPEPAPEQPALVRSLPVDRPVRPQRRGQGRVFRVLSRLAVAAIIVLAALATLHFASSVTAPATAFALPAGLTWNGYVLHGTQSEIDGQGNRYTVERYEDLDNGQMNVETLMPGQMDVVVVEDGQRALGKDMMQHVAEWNPHEWMVSDSTFDLAQLKSDLQAKRAVYLDKDTFHGQPVYRIRLASGLVLLLDMDYMPVNVLRGAVGAGTGEPIYTTLQVLPTQKVPDSMWSMNIPPDFSMGTLPPKP